MSEGVKYPGGPIKMLKGWEHFLARPGMYIGKKSLFGLRCVAIGVQLAEGVRCGAPPDDKFFDMQGDEWFEFEQWTRKKTNNKYNKSFDYALKEAENDDEKAFDVWAEWFKEWKTQCRRFTS